MKRSRVGLVIEDEHVAVAAIRKGGQPAYFRLRADEALPARLTAQLRARRLETRAIRIGLDRSRVMVKAIDVPHTAEENRRSLVAFELERHLPFAAEDTRFDWTPLPGGTDGLGRVLVAATEGPTVDGALRLAESTHTRPRSVTVACHALPILLDRGRLPSRAVWIHGRGARTILLFLERRQVRMSRSVPRGTGSELAAEIERSLPLAGWTQCETVWVSGDETPDFRSSFRRGCLRVAIAAPPLGKTAAHLIKRLPLEERGSALLALAVAVGQRRPPLDLVPGALRARVLSWAQTFTAGMAVAAGGLGLALLLATSYKQSTQLARLNAEIRRLDPEVKAVEQLGADVQLRRQLLSVLQSVQSGGLQPLPVLKDLTELVPMDAWVQSVSMGREGLEVTGLATTASTLISLLEGSPWLERVEFTSPVTRAQAKEQFRLHADWENPVRASADAEPSRPARKGH
ncbi:MAG TPA: PilN domain-containing protein [Methylomirabilota bacterium]|nr:PilN domain-containing protein [Methylomirabilota bacterium]